MFFVYPNICNNNMCECVLCISHCVYKNQFNFHIILTEKYIQSNCICRLIKLTFSWIFSVVLNRSIDFRYFFAYFRLRLCDLGVFVLWLFIQTAYNSILFSIKFIFHINISSHRMDEKKINIGCKQLKVTNVVVDSIH